MALEYIECVADDIKPGLLTSFPQAVKLKDGEVVVFSWIVYASFRDRDRINQLVMTDPYRRHGGFEVVAVRRQADVLWRLQDARRAVEQAALGRCWIIGQAR